MEEKEVYYFGCWGEPGHYLRGARGNSAKIPLLPERWLDSEACEPTSQTHLRGRNPREEDQPQGKGRLLSHAGYTLLSLWDRTGDRRLSSKSIFIVKGEASEAELWAFATKAFPAIVARIKAGG